jgi:signal transduction histidine kinase
MTPSRPGPTLLGVSRPISPDGIRGPFTWWPRVADAVLAAVAFVLMAFALEGPGDTVVFRSLADVPVLALPVFAAGAAALYWRRRHPVVVLVVSLLCVLLTVRTGSGHWGLPVALYSAGRYAEDDWRHVAGGVLTAVVLVIDGIAGGHPWTDSVLAIGFLAVVWYGGRRMRLRAERAAQSEREQAEEARRIVSEERTRIARELHDVVAHRVSLMTVQASAARAVVAQDPDSARQAMSAVEQAGRQALDELRHLLGVLRPDTEDDGLGPQPGLAELPRLVEQAREAGIEVSLASDGVSGAFPARVELSAYRIVQESLTNVLKHAGDGARAEVQVRADADRLVIEVTDDGPGGTSLPGTNHGIVGMRERAALLGGSLDAGPLPDGGYRVLAQLPAAGEVWNGHSCRRR